MRLEVSRNIAIKATQLPTTRLKRQLKAAYLMRPELEESCAVWSEFTAIYRPVVFHATYADKYVRYGLKESRYNQLQQWGEYY